MKTQSRTVQQQFITLALTMAWQLALVVLVPVIIGTQLDMLYDTGRLYTFVGLGVALVGSVFVLWQTVRSANRVPVPKLTSSQKRAIKKSYEDEDEAD